MIGESSAPASAPAAAPTAAPNLNKMTKAALLDYAASVGADVDDSMTKAEIRSVLEA